MKKVKGSDFFCGELFPESTSVEKTEALPNSYDWGDLFERLSQSRFRSKFRLTTKEIVYLKEKGLAPAVNPNDGKQTPMRGHPVFIAQHATGCCCRGCFEKWHRIPAGRELTDEEQHYAVAVVMEWIKRQVGE